jgi:3-phytase
MHGSASFALPIVPVWVTLWSRLALRRSRMRGSVFFGTWALALLAGCSALPPDYVAVPVVAERYVTALTPADNVDSMTVVAGQDGARVLATAKATDRLVIYALADGATLGHSAGPGAGVGELRRPNGIAAVDDLLFVVERDNRRVQVFRLPSLAPLLTFGEPQLRKPYGLWVHARGAGDYRVYVTDQYEGPNGAVPQLAELGERVKVYAVTRSADGRPAAEFEFAFGETSPAGALRIVESIQGDPQHDRLLIAEEDESYGSELKVYDLAGRFTGRIAGRAQFVHQAEGIALRRCADGGGWWIVADQHSRQNRFHLFERRTLDHVYTFRGAVTQTTDGVWLHEAPTAEFPEGVFLASHDDAAVAAFDWADIARAAGLPPRC